MRLLLPLALLAALAWAWLPMRADLPPPRAEGPKSLGVASCASMACHNANGDLGTPRSEYTTYLSVDPHAQAYEALFKEQSKSIQAARGEGKAHEDRLCLACHGAGADAPKARHGDGIGCEQCHGPAEKWKATHYLGGFDRKTPGFRNLRFDLRVRAEACVGCHVG
ncbi:MAG: cytochrome c family protein, partial [Gemmataceae bacterium]|nr:cytochrome c family protein [Gemmataceae bacterium]